MTGVELGLLALVAGGLGAAAWSQSRKSKQMVSLSTAMSAPTGNRTKITGTIACDFPIGAPYSGRKCVAWRSTMLKTSAAGTMPVTMSGGTTFTIVALDGTKTEVDARDHVRVEVPDDWNGRAVESTFGRRAIESQEQLLHENQPNVIGAIHPVAGVAAAIVHSATRPEARPYEAIADAREGIVKAGDMISVTGSLKDGKLVGDMYDQLVIS